MIAVTIHIYTTRGNTQNINAQMTHTMRRTQHTVRTHLGSMEGQPASTADGHARTSALAHGVGMTLRTQQNKRGANRSTGRAGASTTGWAGRTRRWVRGSGW